MISYRVGSYYTTASAAFPLTDARCQRALKEFAAWDWSGEFNDGLTLSDMQTIIRVFTFTESMGVSDDKRVSCVVRLMESVSMTDGTLKALRKRVLDGLYVKDTPRLHPAIHKEEAVKAADDSSRSYTVLLRDGLEIYDPISHRAVWKRTWSYRVAAGELGRRDVTIPFSESMSVSTDGNKSVGKHISESLALLDPLRSTRRFLRTFSENVETTEEKYARYVTTFHEVCRAADFRIENALGILYDIAFTDGPMSLEEFRDQSQTPAGYSPFVDFRVGDYEYQNAMYRFVLQKQDMGVNPLLYDLAVHVDIPDTEDRGTANVAAETTRVYFNKHFYNPPEVVATTVSGTTSGGISIPVVLSTDKSDDAGRYFEVQLQTPSGALVAGRISWTARGY